MASKKSNPRKTSRSAPKKPVAVPSELGQAESGSHKNILRVLIAVVVVVCVIYGMNSFHGGAAPKDIKAQLITQITGEQSKSGHFTAWGIAPIGKDKFAVVDQEDNRIMVFDRQGKFLKAWGKRGNGPSEFQEPSGMTTDGNRHIYVLDTWNGAIKGFDENGKPLAVVSLGKLGGFYGPRGIGFDGQNFIVADSGGQRLALVSLRGDLISAWGSLGNGTGQFKGPLAAVSDGKGNYYVADTDNNRIQILDKDGKVEKVIKVGFSVLALAIDNEGRLYASTTDNSGCIKVYSPTGSYLGDLKGQDGNQPLGGARGLAVSPDDVLMITVGGNLLFYQLSPVTS